MTPLYAAPPLAVSRVNDPLGLRRGRAMLLELAQERRMATGRDPRLHDRVLRDAIFDPVAMFVHGSSALLVATDSGRDVGTAVIHPHADGSVELRYLFTRPSARGAGVGRALLEATLQHCRGAGRRCVWVDLAAEPSDAARALGEAFGFSRTSGAATAYASVLVA